MLWLKHWQNTWRFVIPFAMFVAAHAKLLGSCLHTATHHQAVSRLKDVQRARHPRVGHSANKYRDVLCEAAVERTDTETGKKITRWHHRGGVIDFRTQIVWVFISWRLLWQFCHLCLMDLFPFGQLWGEKAVHDIQNHNCDIVLPILQVLQINKEGKRRFRSDVVSNK